MAPSRYHSNNAVETTLAGAINDTQTTISVASTSGFPTSFPYALALDLEDATQEIVLVTAASGTDLTVTRGYDNSVPQSHSPTARVAHVVIAADVREPLEHVDSASGVHGVTGAVVGTTDTQTLTNKSISGAANTVTDVPANQLTGDFDQGRFVAPDGGTVALTAKAGDAAPTVNVFEVTDSTGAVKLGVKHTGYVHGYQDMLLDGDLTVAGSAAVAGNVDVTGNVTAYLVEAEALAMDSDGSQDQTGFMVGPATPDALYAAKIDKGALPRGLHVDGRVGVSLDAAAADTDPALVVDRGGTGVLTVYGNGDTVAAGQFNSQAGATASAVAGTGIWPGQPVAILYRSTVQSLANDSQATPLTFNTADLNLGSGWSSSSNPSRWTAKIAGWYAVSALVGFATSSAGRRAVFIKKNGTSIGGSPFLPPNPSGTTRVPTPTVYVQMNGTTDYLELYPYQDSGGALDSGLGDGAPTMYIAYAGPA